ncbi:MULTISPECIES: tetratricopeptide repeat protein [Rhodomicrobium]|uniref:tetratricopeptide repeat protein n=1 Tax=Rhodomicrobium TaxID=1068 RepID=UPI001482D029|nr:MULTISPECIES: tetratricopeptide repeat protein [Rhodomicrobium]
MSRVWGGLGIVVSFFVLSMAGGCTGFEDGGPSNASLTEGQPETAQAEPAAGNSSTRNLLKLGNDIEARGSVATAVPIYERAAAEPDADANVHLALADAYAKVNRERDAAESYRKALAKAPDNGRALFGLGTISIRTGQIEAGLKMLERAAPLVNTPQAYDRLGVAHMMSGQPREALASFEQAYRLDNRDPDIATNLTLAAALLSQRDRAISLARQTLTLANVKPYHRRNLILALGISGKSDEAQAAADRQLAPGELEGLVERAEKIRQISSAKERAIALGTVRLAAAR